MSPLLLTLLAWLPAPSWDRTWRSELEAGNYLSAWNLAEDEPGGVERYRARATILYRAGDPAGALAASEAGLELQADQLELLHHAAGAAIWLEESAMAIEYSTRLLHAVDSAESSRMLPGELAAWRASALNFMELSRTLASSAEGRRRSMERSRAVSTAGLGAAAALAAWVAWRYGRSSRPVS